jgi:hypothetical protein
MLTQSRKDAKENAKNAAWSRAGFESLREKSFLVVDNTPAGNSSFLAGATHTAETDWSN